MIIDSPAHQRERTLYGEQHATEFVAEHADLVVRLIALYTDRDAERLLEDLRTLFWSGGWTPKKKPTSIEAP